MGVGTTTPTEKLDVNGNVNVNGQLKLNGSAGTANQVMMKDANNNPVWGDLSSYQNIAVFDCSGVALTPNTSNCTQIWTVPAGVTSILVECWGGGGGASAVNGGAGGGYITAKINVAPASNATLTIGAGGRVATSAAFGVSGGTTSFTVGSFSMNATGGQGGDFRNLSNSNMITFQPLGGIFSAVGLGNNFYGLSGKSGGVSERSYTQVSQTEFASVIRFGNGGDAGNAVGSGAKGGYSINSVSFFNNFYGEIVPSQPGGGGSADLGNGYQGRAGRIIIRW